MYWMNSNDEGGWNFRLLGINTSQISTPSFKASEFVETLGLKHSGTGKRLLF